MIESIIGIAGMIASFGLGYRIAQRRRHPKPTLETPLPGSDSVQMKRDFVANVSHELKTPITLIKGFIETLKNGAIHDPETALEFLTIMDTHTLNMESIINNLLDLSRLEHAQHSHQIDQEPEPICPIIESVIRTANLRYPQHTEILWHPTKYSKIQFSMITGLVEQALYNLVENALLHGNNKHPIVIEITQTRRHWQINVTNEGNEIPPAQQTRIFERFYQIDSARTRNKHGSGLGLAIVKHIMHLHHGNVTVRSASGKTTFSLLFPMS